MTTHKPFARLAGTLMTLSLCASACLVSPMACADGLRLPAQWSPSGSSENPNRLRFSISRYDSTSFDTSSPNPASLLSSDTTPMSRNNALWADWYPFGNSGLRTSAGLSWNEPMRRGSNDLFSAGGDSGFRSRAFVGLGWTSAASSSSSLSGWRLSADFGAAISTQRDCVTTALSCGSSSGFGLKPSSGDGNGIRWNPFISIGATLQY